MNDQNYKDFIPGLKSDWWDEGWELEEEEAELVKTSKMEESIPEKESEKSKAYIAELEAENKLLKQRVKDLEEYILSGKTKKKLDIY